jgi:hypothetical protein
MVGCSDAVRQAFKVVRGLRPILVPNRFQFCSDLASSQAAKILKH